MDSRSRFASVIARIAIIALAAQSMSACAALAPPPTPTPIPTATQTPPPTSTPTPRPTATSTATPVPTPAQVGAAVPHGDLEITVLKVATHDLIVPGGFYYYYPKDRSNTFLDLGVKLRNTGEDQFLTGNALLIELSDGTELAPEFADYEARDIGANYDPFSVGISTPGTFGVSVLGGRDVYLRLIYVIAPNQTILFGIGESPRISVTVSG